MSYITTLAARHLSRRGEHAAALAKCNASDIEVLSRAGMHLSVLECAREGMLPLGIARAHVGDIDGALEIAARHLGSKAVRPLIGQLAVLAPERVLPLVTGRRRLEDIQHFCEYAMGIIDIDPERLNCLPVLLSVAVAQSKGWPDIARIRLNQFFNDAGLVAPQIDWSAGRLNFSRAICEQNAAASVDGPLISVILTAHNEERYLPCAVRSILRQTWRNVEIIIVDDGSRDDTAIVAKALAAEDGRIRAIRLDDNIGTWRAKNLGLSHAHGELLTMHDADDWSHPCKLEFQARPLVRDSRLMCSSSYFFRVSEETGRIFTRNAASFLRWNPSSLLFRRSVMGESGDYFADMLGGDCEFSARIETCCGAASHHKIYKPLSMGWQRAGSLSNRYRQPEDIRHRLQQWENWRRLHVRAFSSRRTAQICKSQIDFSGVTGDRYK